MGHNRQLLAILFLFLPLTFLASPAMAKNEVRNIRHWVAPDHTRIVIDTSEEPIFTVDKGEQTVAIDIESASLSSGLPLVTVIKKPGIEKISLSYRQGTGVRVFLSLTGSLQTNVFKLKKFQEKPDRIVIDIALQDSTKRQEDAIRPEATPHRARVVVIDPGHGGDAPGAVGKKGTQEKGVVLAISKRIRDILNKIDGYQATLTRDADYYVSFRKRLRFARESGADLFISVHADASRNREASGSSVYCLSVGGASSEAARILANSENLADIVGGVPSSEGSDASDPIILDMFQTNTINQSRSFGMLLLKELSAANHLKFTTVQEAPFIVLKLPEIPSVLVETAFISNANEENLLRSSRFQGRIAEGIVKSIVEFIPPLPEAHAEVGADKKVVKKTADPPREAPEVENSKQLAFPAKAKESEKKVSGKKPLKISKPAPPASYRVKRGDTLIAIAEKHGTTVKSLIDLNHLKRPYKLHAGRKLHLR